MHHYLLEGRKSYEVFNLITKILGGSILSSLVAYNFALSICY